MFFVRLLVLNESSSDSLRVAGIIRMSQHAERVRGRSSDNHLFNRDVRSTLQSALHALAQMKYVLSILLTVAAADSVNI